MILVVLSNPLKAQGYLAQIQHYSIDEGLSHREVHHVFQDSRGLIWISTRYGLNRFDGQHFTWFTKEKQGLSSNQIQKVVEDAQGWLWIFSARQGSDFVFDFVDLLNVRTLELMPWVDRQAPFSPSEIVECVASPKRELFFGTKTGTCWKLDSTGAFVAILLGGLQNFTPKYCSENGTVWGVENLADAANLLEISASGEVLQKFTHAPGSEFAIAGKDADGQLWYRILRENKASVFFIRLNLNVQRQAYDLTRTPLGDISGKISYDQHRLHINPKDHSLWWTGTDLFAISTADGRQVAFLQEKYPGIAYSNSVFFDKDGRGWVGTIDGVFYATFEPSRFRNLLSLPFQEASFADCIECRGITEAQNGEVYVNSYAGTFRLSPDGKILQENFLGVPKDLKWASMAMYATPSGDTWFGWQRPAKLDAKTGALHFYQLPPDIGQLNIWAICRQPSGRIWFAGLKGDFAFLEPDADTLRMFENYGGFEELKKASILSIHERPDGHLWLCANTGLYVFDPIQQKILQRYWTGGEGQYYLPNDNIHHLNQEGDSLLWLATGGGGLIQLAVRSEAKIPNLLRDGSRQSADGSTQFTNSRIHQFTKADGLPSNVLYAVYADDFGNLWMSSDYGIIQFNKESKLSRTFLPGDGLPHYEFNRISHYQAKSGQLYFGSLNGVTTFHPRDFQNFTAKNDAPLVLLGLQQFDGEKNQLVNKLTEFTKRPEIVLHPGDRVVNLEFALLDYNAPERIRYAYRVEGVDDKWNYLQENHISLSGLPYGDFTLIIKGQAATGVFSSQQLNIPLRVLKPFYLKTWFPVLAGLVLLVAGTIFFNFRTRKLEKQKHQLKVQVEQRTETIRQQNEQLAGQAIELRHLDEVKSRFLANVSHELRTPLTLLLGPIGSVLKSNLLDNRNFTLLKKAQRSGKDLLRLINEILDLSKMESGRMELNENPVQLYPLLRRYFAQFESHARLQGLQLVFEYQASEELQILLDTEKFEKVVNNFLANAIKFTPNGGRVILLLKEMDGKVVLSVSDTGQGIHPDDMPHVFDRFYQTSRPEAPAEGGTGIGLALVNEYAHLFSGKTWVESDLGKGSTFNFEFPKKLVAAGSWEQEPIMDEIETQETTSELVAPSHKVPNPSNIRPNILVVEDNPELRDYLRLILEEKYEVVTAENGQVALGCLLPSRNFGTRPADCQLILSDIMMPVMDGYQLLEKLKSDDRYRHIPVIMLTARADLRDKLKALRIGVDDYLLKPFEEEELLVRIENLLKNSRNRRLTTEAASEEKTEAATLTQADADWLAEVEQLAQEGLDKKLLSVNWLSEKANLSERQLRRRLQKVTGLSPQQYLTELRLQEARSLLSVGKFQTVAEVAYAVGYHDAPAFSRSFRNYFGKSPSDFMSA